MRRKVLLPLKGLFVAGVLLSELLVVHIETSAFFPFKYKSNGSNVKLKKVSLKKYIKYHIKSNMRLRSAISNSLIFSEF